MAKKKPSLKPLSSSQAAPALSLDDMIQMLDKVIMGGVSDKGPPAQAPAIIPQQGGAGMLSRPIPQGTMSGAPLLNEMPRPTPMNTPPNRGFASLMNPGA